MNAIEFTKIFGSEGHEKRFEGLKPSEKSTDISTGCFIVYDNKVFFEYEDFKGRLYHCETVPTYTADLKCITKQLKGI